MSISTSPKCTLSITGQSEPNPLLDPQRVLAIGQKTPEGSAVSGELVKSIGNNGEESQLFGSKSMAAEIVRSFKRLNKTVDIDAISLDDNPLGVKSQGLLRVNGIAQKDSKLEFTIQSRRFHRFSIDIKKGETSEQISKKMSDAINSDLTINVTADSQKYVFIGTLGGLSISTDDNQSYVNKTTADGLGSNSVRSLYNDSQILYAGTSGGLSISTDRGQSFVNRTTTDGLGSNVVQGVFAKQNSVYCATTVGFSFSTNFGLSFTNKTTADGLGSNFCYATSSDNGVIYVSTQSGVSVSTDFGETFSNKTTLDGLGSNFSLDVAAHGDNVYAATLGGLSISTDNGQTFTNKTIADGLLSNFVIGVCAMEGGLVYVSQFGGLSISRDGGQTFENKTLADGLAASNLWNCYKSDDLYVLYITASGLSISKDNGQTFVQKTTADGLISNSARSATVMFENSIEITATNSGTIGNEIGFKIDSLPDGIVSSEFKAMGQQTLGVNDPDLSNVFIPINNRRYQTIIWPSNYDFSEIKKLLVERFNVSNDVLDGIAITTSKGNIGNAISISQSLDSELIAHCPLKEINQFHDSSSDIFEFTPSVSSQFAAIRSARLSLGDNVSSFLASTALNGGIGGPKFAGIPYHQTPFRDLALVENNSGWTADEQEKLIKNGAFVLGNNIENSQVISSEVVTTKQGGLSSSFLNYVDTASTIREFFFRSNLQEYAQAVLTDGTIVSGVRMANEGSIRIFQQLLYSRLSLQQVNGVDYELASQDRNAFRQFVNTLNVSVNKSNSMVTISAAVPIVSQLREIDSTVEIVFDLAFS